MKRVLYNNKNFMWFKLVEGKIKWNNQLIDHIYLQNNPFPFPKHIVFTAANHAKLEECDSNELIRNGNFINGINLYFKLYFEFLKIKFIKNSSENNQIIKRLEKESHDFNRLIKIFNKFFSKNNSKKITHDITESTLFDALSIVADAIGIKLKNTVNFPSYSQSDINFYLKKNHISSRKISINNSKWWLDDCGPLLGYLKINENPVALLPAKNGGYYMIDPTQGTKVLISENNSKELKETAIMLIRNFSEKPVKFSEMMKQMLVGNKYDVFRIIILSLFMGILSLSIPIAIKILFGIIIPENKSNDLVFLVLILGAITISSSLFSLYSIVGFIKM